MMTQTTDVMHDQAPIDLLKDFLQLHIKGMEKVTFSQSSYHLTTSELLELFRASRHETAVSNIEKFRPQYLQQDGTFTGPLNQGSTIFQSITESPLILLL